MLRQLNLSPEESLSFSEEKGEVAKAKSPWDFVPAGHKIGKPAPLFKELVGLCISERYLLLGCTFTCINLIWMQKDETVALHREKYAGSQAERSSKAAADAEANKVANKLKGTKLSGNNLKILILSYWRQTEIHVAVGELCTIFP